MGEVGNAASLRHGDEWNGRLVTLAELPSPDGGSMPVLCLEPHDLAVDKLAAGRPKDIEFGTR